MAEGAIDTQNRPITSEQIKEVSVSDPLPPLVYLDTGELDWLGNITLLLGRYFLFFLILKNIFTVPHNLMA